MFLSLFTIYGSKGQDLLILNCLPEVRCLRELVVVELDEGRDGLLYTLQLHQRHLTVLREETERLKKNSTNDPTR